MKSATIFLIFMLLCFNIFGQEVTSQIKYISPKPGSKLIMPGNNIVIRPGEKIDVRSVKQDLFKVSKDNHEEIFGKVKLSDDGMSLIFKPAQPYSLGDKIQVSLNEGLKLINGQQIQPINFHFEVIHKIIQIPLGYFTKDLNKNLFPVQNIFIPKTKKIEKKENNLPEGYPGIQVNVLNENTNGYYFFAPYDDLGWFPDTKHFLTITDIYGTPVYYRQLETPGYDIKIQPTGNLSFYSFHPFWRHMVMDSSYRIVDDFAMGNGYSYTDFHDFQLLDNGHAFVMTYDPQLYPMDTVVPGGHPNAIVTGFVFQELDLDKEVIFQWRSWDHFLITDAGPFVNLTDSIIDYVHGNTLEIESDTSLLISSRNMDEITRIDRNTGDIIWRFGGKNNQFEFLNDTLGFSVQHDCRRLNNGNITLFDNGSLHPDPKFSSGLEYEMNEVNMTVSLVSRLRSIPDIFGVVMGNMQWRDNNSKVIGWGWGVPGISEFDVNGDVVYEMEFEGISYRSYLFPWKSNYFTLNKDTLQYGFIWQESSLIKTMKVYNIQNHDIQLTSYYSMNEAFSIIEDFPITIHENQYVQLHVEFNPDDTGEFAGMLTINSDINSDTLVQRIAQQVYLTGNATLGQSVNQNTNPQILIYPNPAVNNLTIEFPIASFSGNLKIYNIYGAIIVSQQLIVSQKVTLNLAEYSKGLYFVSLTEQYNTVSQLFKIVKD